MTLQHDQQDEADLLIESARDYARAVLLPHDRSCDPSETPMTSLLPELGETLEYRNAESAGCSGPERARPHG